MSDSTEVYESRPNRFLIYTIYLIFILMIVAFLWLSFFEIDIVVKGNGIFKGLDESSVISSVVTGKVTESLVKNGQYVKEGDSLYKLSVDSLGESIKSYQERLQNINDRLTILAAYEKSLDEDATALEVLPDNPYYMEFTNKRNLLFVSIESTYGDNESTKEVYLKNINTILESIENYNGKIIKLNDVKECITTRTNTFNPENSYYYAMMNSYVASYNYTALQYNIQIEEYKNQIKEYDSAIENIDKEEVAQNNSVNVKTLKSQKYSVNQKMIATESEKNQALRNLELQQLATVEQQIETLHDTIFSMQTNLTSAKLQLETAGTSDSQSQKKIKILTEKGIIATEILAYKDKKEECENYLKSYDIKNNNCVIKASSSGYFYTNQDIKAGTYVQEGNSIGQIYPEEQSGYYAEIYVNNADIAKIKLDQEVKFEIVSYPSSEYGYFTGTVENIAKDITVDHETGSAYYLVKVKCSNLEVMNKEGDRGVLMNGMATQAKVIIDKKNVLKFILEKIDILD